METRKSRFFVGVKKALWEFVDLESILKYYGSEFIYKKPGFLSTPKLPEFKIDVQTDTDS